MLFDDEFISLFLIYSIYTLRVLASLSIWNRVKFCPKTNWSEKFQPLLRKPSSKASFHSALDYCTFHITAWLMTTQYFYTSVCVYAPTNITLHFPIILYAFIAHYYWYAQYAMPPNYIVVVLYILLYASFAYTQRGFVITSSNI